MDATAARTRLEAERARLEEVRHAAGRLSNETLDTEGGAQSGDVHPNESAPQQIERELDEGVVMAAEAELLEVTAALERVDAGTYGMCEECGEPIPEGRLEIVPAARRCVADQQKGGREARQG
jgi:DnaK suppressor protein